MQISDEQLSAFLDQELSASEMMQIREALSVDLALADRLAELAVTDELVRAHASAIDSVPMPDSITRLLKPNKVIDISWWRRTHQQITEHAALAASVALMLGLGFGYLIPADTPAGSADPDWQLLASHLETAPSGTSLRVTADTQLVNRFSFVDQKDTYCRQFALQTASNVSENVACRVNGGWELIASAQISRVYNQGEYSLASGTGLLDSTLDAMMSGQALSLEDEAALIEQRWSSSAGLINTQ